jgi:hypothetical protein
MESPATRADRLLRDVLGDQRYHQLRSVGYLDIPSRQRQGRVYRLDSLGNLSYRDPGETGFNTSMCVQPEEAVPRDDQIAMRYLLVTADEARLLKVANPITFGFVSLVRALHHDFAHRHPAWAAAFLSAVVVLFFLGSLALEGWLLLHLLGQNPSLAVFLAVLFALPAFIGGVLVAAGTADITRFVQTWRARRALATS